MIKSSFHEDAWICAHKLKFACSSGLAVQAMPTAPVDHWCVRAGLQVRAMLEVVAVDVVGQPEAG